MPNSYINPLKILKSNSELYRYNVWFIYAPIRVRKIIRKYSKIEKVELFSEDLEFGTAGVRGKMLWGSSSINEITVARISLAYGAFIYKKFGLGKIVIGRDNRENGTNFLNISAAVLKKLGFKVHISDLPIPTPFLSYSILKLKALGGLMITASHNSKEYNGIKLYDKNGVQLPDPYTKEVEEINSKLFVWNIKKIQSDFSKIPETLYKQYIKDVLKNMPISKPASYKNLSVTYTPLQGAGLWFIEELNKIFKIDLNIVKTQSNYSPDFKNITSPNPGKKDAFKLAEMEAIKNNSDLIIATDPDADRIGVMVKHDDKYVFLNGDELGMIQLTHIIRKTSTLQKRVVVKSDVSSDIINSICSENKIELVTTKTGFKNLIFSAEQEKKKNKNVIFVYEESFGSRIIDINGDKDGIQAFSLIVNLALSLKKVNKTIIDYIEEIYKKYGKHYLPESGKEILYEKNSINFEKFFNNIGNFEYINELGANDIVLKIIKDKLSKKVEWLTKHGWAKIRMSGTEPLIRFYYDTKDFDEKKIFDEVFVKLKNKIEK